jgi:hypothetical protein
MVCCKGCLQRQPCPRKIASKQGDAERRPTIATTAKGRSTLRILRIFGGYDVRLGIHLDKQAVIEDRTPHANPNSRMRVAWGSSRD